MRGWADVGLWVAVCFLAKISLHRPKTTFAHLVTGNFAVKSLFMTFRNKRNEQVSFFFVFRNSFFLQNYRFLYHGDQKISCWRVCRWRAVNFEIHLCSSSLISECIWRSASIQYVQMWPGMNSDLGNSGSFCLWVEIRDAEHVDRCSWKCTRVRSHQLTSDLKRRYFFLEMLAIVVSESGFGAFVCLRRPAGAPATSALVATHHTHTHTHTELFKLWWWWWINAKEKILVINLIN